MKKKHMDHRFSHGPRFRALCVGRAFGIPASARRRLAVSACFLLCLGACRKSGADATEPGDPAAESRAAVKGVSRPDPATLKRITGRKHMNVLFISVDTTRADALGCFGNRVVRTPNVDRLSASGTRFEQCISSAPLTLVSHSTMMTGSYQYVHGARDNGGFQLADANVTLAEIFKEEGYATAAEVAAAVLDPPFGLGQGFEHYISVSNVDAGDAGDPADAGIGGQQLGAKVPGAPSAQVDRKAGEITDAGIRRLRDYAKGEKPFFLFLHYYDPHWPHEAPSRFAEQYADPYFAEIAYFDQQFGRLMNEFRRLGLEENTLVLLVSDHGEGRGQHGENTHSCFIYDATQHVPFVMSCPGIVPAGVTVRSQVRLVDLAQTILEFVGLGHRKTPQMQGESLLPLLAEPSLDLGLPTYSDTITPKTMYGYAPLRSIRTDGWKYILAPKPELYHVAADPLELFNLYQSEPDLSRDLRQRLWDLIAESPKPPWAGNAAIIDVDPAALEKLRALGYICSTSELEGFSSGDELAIFEIPGANPHDHVTSIETLASALGANRVGKYEIAERLLREFLETNPEHRAAIDSLGSTLAAQKKWMEAVSVFRNAVRLAPDSVAARRSLGVALSFVGKGVEAVETLREAVKLDENDAVTHYALGTLHSARNEPDQAFFHFDRAESLGISKAAVENERGLLHARQGRMDEALKHLEESRKLDPKLPGPLVAIAYIRRVQGDVPGALKILDNLPEGMTPTAAMEYERAACLSELEDHDGAMRALQRMTEADPDSADTMLILAQYLVSRGKDEEAADAVRKAAKLKNVSFQAGIRLAGQLKTMGRGDEATGILLKIKDRWPGDCARYRDAANMASSFGREDAAVEILKEAVKNCEQDAGILNDLAWRLASSSDVLLRDGEEAVRWAKLAVSISESHDPHFLDTLAAAYAEAGDFEKAVATARQAEKIAKEMEQPQVAEEIAARLKLYEQEKPYRDGAEHQ